MSPLSPSDRRFALICALVAAILAAVPALFGVLSQGPGRTYLGLQYNFDDHMVYAAWMRQAMDGAITFDNRFAVESQPGLTFHAYFLILGWLAKAVGIPLAMFVARLFFTGWFVWLLFHFIRRLTSDYYLSRVVLILVTFGAGFGFFIWHNYGVDIVKPAPDAVKNLLLGKLPIDVWQPEAFVFPSMLTNGLFMVSLCLILFIFDCVLAAKDDPKVVLKGALAMAALMNIHSYDALLVALVLLGFLAAETAQKNVTKEWLLRSMGIAAGAILPALWFVYVLRNDPVFQARAATETYSPNIRQIFAGLGLLVLFGLVSIITRDRIAGLKAGAHRRYRGFVAALVMIIVMSWAASTNTSGYWLSWTSWSLAAIGVLIVVTVCADRLPAWNLIISWAFIGLIAPFLPALFQRKLAMGIAIPWAILAACGAYGLTHAFERGKRNLLTILACVTMCGTSIQWLAREFLFIRRNVSNTTMHAVTYSRDLNAIIQALSTRPGRKVVVAMPGINSREQAMLMGEKEYPIDSFDTPLVTDLNPVLAGLAGVYSFAGHWSETPNYGIKRGLSTRLFLRETSEADRREILRRIGADYIVAPAPEAFILSNLAPASILADLRPYGKVVYEGNQFDLIELK